MSPVILHSPLGSKIALSYGGFDMTVPERIVKNLGFDDVLKQLNHLNDEAPIHILVLGLVSRLALL